MCKPHSRVIKNIAMKFKYGFIQAPFMALLLVAGLLTSCGGPKGTTKDVKMLTLISPHNKILNGHWMVDSVRIDSNFTQEEANNVPLLEDAPAACYIGGDWLIGDGGEGSYTVTGKDCVKGRRMFEWNILKGDKTHFIAFRRTTAPKDVLVARYTTYSFEVVQINKSTMLCKYPVKYNDKKGNMFVRFHKTSNKTD